MDVSFADGNQVGYGADATINIVSAKVISIADADTAKVLDLTDFPVTAYNKFGGTTFATGITLPTLTNLAVDGTLDDMYFTMGLGGVAVSGANADPDAIISRVVISIAKDEVELADPRAELNDTGARKAVGKGKATSIELHYVGTEPGLMAWEIHELSLLSVSVTCYFL